MKEQQWKLKNAMKTKKRGPATANFHVNKSRGGSSQKRSG